MKEGRKLKEEIQRGMMTQHGDIKKYLRMARRGRRRAGKGELDMGAS